MRRPLGHTAPEVLHHGRVKKACGSERGCGCEPGERGSEREKRGPSGEKATQRGQPPFEAECHRQNEKGQEADRAFREHGEAQRRVQPDEVGRSRALLLFKTHERVERSELKEREHDVELHAARKMRKLKRGQEEKPS